MVPLLIFFAAALWSRGAVETEAKARLARTVDMLHEHARRSLETQEAVLEAIEQRIEGMSWAQITASREVQAFLAALAERVAPSGGIALAGPDARLAVGSFGVPPSPIDLSDRDYVRATRAGHEGTYIGEVIVTRPNRATVFSVSRARRTGEAPDGWIVSSFRPGYFEDFYRSVAEAPGDVITLARDDGAILARSPPPARIEDYRPSGRSALARMVRESPDKGVIRVPSRVDGIERLYAYRRVEGYPLYVIYGLSQSVVQRAWTRQLLAYAAVCAIAASLLLWLTGRAQGLVEREQAALAAARAEAERRAEAEGRLRHSQRIDALGQIVGGVAHDFANVVQGIKAGAGRIARRAEEPEEVRRVAVLMEATAERGARLTGRMLAFARREDARSATADPCAALAGVRDLLADTLGSGYRLALRCPEAIAPVATDQAELETVVVNLALNARDAMPGGGTVVVEAAEEAAAEDDACFVRITVSDTGVGMDEATLARAGEAFFSTKGSKGTGLGLSMARAFAEGAGGRLEIESQLGAGTRVSLRLPVAGTEGGPEEDKGGAPGAA